ncbi:MAG TPA: hypothetical protein VH518_07780 [Tepidisphaeraceae bacterium]|jgi:hypothetical protein
MQRTLCVLCLTAVFASVALAQSQTPPDLARLPEAIKTLPWKSIDLSTVKTLEYDRAILILNHVLDELGPMRASEADLMSTYIEQQNLGAELSASGPPPTLPLTYTDGVKIAVAILRGPLANSSYAQQFAGAPESTLAGYRQMYDSTCQRRWAETAEATTQVRYMSALLQKKGKTKDYESWAKVESENRQLKYDQEMSQKKDAAAANQAQQAAARQEAAAQQAKLEQENRQLQEALASAQAQQQQTAQAQQQIDQQAQQPVPEAGLPNTFNGWYAPTYYGAGATWCHDAAYAGAARASTEARMATWHGAGRR